MGCPAGLPSSPRASCKTDPESGDYSPPPPPPAWLQAGRSGALLHADGTTKDACARTCCRQHATYRMCGAVIRGNGARPCSCLFHARVRAPMGHGPWPWDQKTTRQDASLLLGHFTPCSACAVRSFPGPVLESPTTLRRPGKFVARPRPRPDRQTGSQHSFSMHGRTF